MSALAQGLFMGLSMRLKVQTRTPGFAKRVGIASSFMGDLFRLSASDFLCFAKESHQRKATPGTPPLRFATGCPAVLGQAGGCGTREAR